MKCLCDSVFNIFQLSFTALFIYCHSEFKVSCSIAVTISPNFNGFDHFSITHSLILGENFIFFLSFLSLFPKLIALNNDFLLILCICECVCFSDSIINLAKISESFHGISFSLRLILNYFFSLVPEQVCVMCMCCENACRQTHLLNHSFVCSLPNPFVVSHFDFTCYVFVANVIYRHSYALHAYQAVHAFFKYGYLCLLHT